MDLKEILEIGKIMKELDLDMIIWAVALLKGGLARAGADGRGGFGWGQRVLMEKTDKSFWKCVKKHFCDRFGKCCCGLEKCLGHLKGLYV